jgi:hypothetical protein
LSILALRLLWAPNQVSQSLAEIFARARRPETKEQPMKHFLITYTRIDGSEEAWHRDIAAFISALDNDPDLRGTITYRCMKVRDGSNYYHLATAVDEQAIKALQQSEFFKRYTEQTRIVAGGEVSVTPLEIIAETDQRS